MNHTPDYQIDQLIKLLERGDISDSKHKKFRDLLSKNRRSEENTNVIIGSTDKIDTSQIILHEDSIPHTGNSYPSAVQRNLEYI